MAARTRRTRIDVGSEHGSTGDRDAGDNNPTPGLDLDLRGRLKAGEELGLLRGELLVGQDAALVQIAEPFEGCQHRIGIGSGRGCPLR
jgi:hypothetical protein